MEPPRSISVTSTAPAPAAVIHPLISSSSSSSLSSNMLPPISAPYTSQEVVVVENAEPATIEGVPADHSEARAAAGMLNPTPVRLSGEYKESEYGMRIWIFFYLVCTETEAYLSVCLMLAVNGPVYKCGQNSENSIGVCASY